MRLSLRKPVQQLFCTSGQAYARAGAFALFQEAARKLVSRISEDETELFQRRIITGFVEDMQPDIVWRSETDANGVLLLTEAATPEDPPAILVVKRAFGAEMMTPLKSNVKALHALILSCFEQLETGGRLPATLVVTDGISWFWFEADDIQTYFIDHPRLRRIFQLKQQGKSETLVYGEIARTIREIQADIPVIYLNLRDLVSSRKDDTADWVSAFLLFRNLYTSPAPGDVVDPELVEALTAIREVIPSDFARWFCRLFFLRALECKLAAIGAPVPTALGEIRTDDDLTAVLYVWQSMHPALLAADAGASPTVNNPKERHSLSATDAASPLVQLAQIMAACEFVDGMPPSVVADDRFVISAAGIDWLLAWVAQEAGASLATRRAVARAALQEALLKKFNEFFGWTTDQFSQLPEKLVQVSASDALEVLRSLSVCDVYAGSGRFLQIVLQELVRAQHALGLLADGQGQSLHHYALVIANEQLQLATLDGEPVYYQLTEPFDRHTEPQRIRKALFEAKKALMASILYGVVPDDACRTIALTRLSLELLMDMYAITDKRKGITWPAFPSLTWQLQSGHALHYQLDLSLPLLYGEEELSGRLEHLQQQMQLYRGKETAAAERKIARQLDEFRQHLQAQAASADRPLLDRLTRLQAIYRQRYAGNLLFPEQLTPSQQADQEKLQLEIARLTNRIRQRQTEDHDGFEWRIRWPARLDQNGAFKGFEIVISQPPVTSPDVPENKLNGFKTQYKAVYTGKAPAFVYFVWLSVSLLAEKSTAWLVLPDGWETKASTKKLQKWLAEQSMVRPATSVGTEATVGVIRVEKQPAEQSVNA
ncbi:DUF7149 domain-containing protein [Arsenicibacter rosenii]|uniref:site-specific DNA-methyltransferase (adenine-specific) n=1 Tax=Arsenicibacter rosenii TaxID=1750698 RepID=A0A1S2VJC9_9BACT|nr:hypothetical protein [Arsenicibacter rosenii]OIN58864.1 hypothetical protein BLX24_11580 [Arsenicibacter rosenii]